MLGRGMEAQDDAGMNKTRKSFSVMEYNILNDTAMSKKNVYYVG